MREISSSQQILVQFCKHILVGFRGCSACSLADHHKDDLFQIQVREIESTWLLRQPCSTRNKFQISLILNLLGHLEAFVYNFINVIAELAVRRVAVWCWQFHIVSCPGADLGFFERGGPEAIIYKILERGAQSPLKWLLNVHFSRFLINLLQVFHKLNPPLLSVSCSLLNYANNKSNKPKLHKEQELLVNPVVKYCFCVTSTFYCANFRRSELSLILSLFCICGRSFRMADFQWHSNFIAFLTVTGIQ